MTRPMPPAPAVTRTRNPFAEVSKPAMIALRPAAFLQFQLPELADGRRTEGGVRLGLRQLLEARLAVDGPRGSEMGMRPQHELPIALGARKGHAFLDEPAAEARAARGRLDEQQAQLGVGLSR